jgi:hypothetical protein
VGHSWAQDVTDLLYVRHSADETCGDEVNIFKEGKVLEVMVFISDGRRSMMHPGRLMSPST